MSGGGENLCTNVTRGFALLLLPLIILVLVKVSSAQDGLEWNHDSEKLKFVIQKKKQCSPIMF